MEGDGCVPFLKPRCFVGLFWQEEEFVCVVVSAS
jgi:hypothetical protein